MRRYRGALLSDGRKQTTGTVLLLVAICWFSNYGSLSAQEQSSDAFFVPLSGGADLTPAQQNILERIQNQKSTETLDLVTVDSEKLNNPTVNFNLSADASVVASTMSYAIKPTGYGVWEGQISTGLSHGGSSDSILTIVGGKVNGTIFTSSGVYAIRPLGGGIHALIRLKTDAYPEEHPPIEEREKDKSNPNKLDLRGDTVGVSQIDLLVAYTDGANDNVASIDILGLINLAVAETNSSFRNSQVNAEVRLAGTLAVNYQETDYVTDVRRLEDPSDGHMDDIHTTRKDTNADIVVLIVNNDSFCGYAADILADANSAFVLVHHDCATGYFSFGHEIGHLLGARHNPEEDNTPGYSHGYYIPAREWRSIMSYNCPSGCIRYPYWSTPHINLATGESIGTAASHNNALTVNENAPGVSGFMPGTI